MVEDFAKLDLENREFRDALRIVEQTNHSLFLTGRAGTGKSTFLRYIMAHTKKKVAVVAPTGIAAINVNGVTIHSFFKLPFKPLMADDPDFSVADGRLFETLKYTRSHVKLITNLELLIIDEISMVRADIIDFIDKILRQYTKKLNRPFGGIQLLMVGDVFQLEPVVKRDDWQIMKRFYKTPYFFAAQVFNEHKLISVELKKVYRQNDAFFVDLLDKVRVNRISRSELDAINKQYNPTFKVPQDEFFITLATKRDVVDYINEGQLEALPSQEYLYEGVIVGDFPVTALPTNKVLIIKENSQVMFVKNDIDKRWFNGTLGKVIGLDESGVQVLLEDGTDYLVRPVIWENIRYSYNEVTKKIDEEVLGSFMQLPLKLAWAITVHKSQGLTFDRVVLDLTGGTFAGGQLYVALSRCRSLDGMVLKSQVTQHDIIVNPEVVRFGATVNDKILIEESLKGAVADDEYRRALEAFERNNIAEAVEHFATAVESRNDLKLPVVKRFVTKKLGKITKLEKQIKELEASLKRQYKSVKEFAEEYYSMADDCIAMAKDYHAGIANLNKAIRLNSTFTAAYLKRGIFSVELADYEDAERDFTKVISLDKQSADGYTERAAVRMLLNKNAAAKQDLISATKLSPNDGRAYYLLGKVLTKLGDVEEADKFFNIAASLGFKGGR